jgi:acetoacetyl-CoA reductase
MGRVALVTGGSRGIGAAISKALQDAGYTVAANYAGNDEAARKFTDETGIKTYKWSVADYDACAAGIRQVEADLGPVEVLVNNAGITRDAMFHRMTAEQWREVIDTNLTGVFYACHAAIPPLRKRGGGFIINISSLAGKNAFVGAAAYCASKSGLNAFSEALMQEVRYDDIRVSYIMPGSVATGFSGGDEHRGADWKVAPEDVAEVVMNLLRHDPRSLPSRVELRPTKPRK